MKFQLYACLKLFYIHELNSSVNTLLFSTDWLPVYSQYSNCLIHNKFGGSWFCHFCASGCWVRKFCFKSAHVILTLGQVPSATSFSISTQEEEYLPYYCYLRDATVVTRWYSRLFITLLADIYPTLLPRCFSFICTRGRVGQYTVAA
jgi:hypothetical protein